MRRQVHPYGGVVFDDDGEDFTTPFTAIGMLSWAVTMVMAGDHHAIERVITQLAETPENYRW